MKSNNQTNIKLNKGHLSFINLVIGVFVVVLYVNEVSPLLKGIFISFYFFSLWVTFAFRGIKIMMEEEEEEIDDEFIG
jgi:hypothetical protein